MKDYVISTSSPKTNIESLFSILGVSLNADDQAMLERVSSNFSKEASLRRVTAHQLALVGLRLFLQVKLPDRKFLVTTNHEDEMDEKVNYVVRSDSELVKGALLVFAQ